MRLYFLDAGVLLGILGVWMLRPLSVIHLCVVIPVVGFLGMVVLTQMGVHWSPIPFPEFG